MTNLLTAISGRFSTSVVLGTFFPATVFAVLFRVLVISAIPSELYIPVVAPLQAMDERWEALLILLAAVVITGLLQNFNIPLIRTYEGYTWEHSWYGRMRKRRHTHRAEALEARKARAYALLGLLESRLGRVPENSPEPKCLKRQVADAQAAMGENVRAANEDYPKLTSVLPTRLGNVIRAFESYPQRQYEMDAITLWPRLQGVIGKEYAEMMGAAKAEFDFMINSATLAAMLALGMLAALLAFPERAAAPAPLMREMLAIAAFLGVAYWMYMRAIDQARAWGAMVRGAFDLYRWDLLKLLGYQKTPRTPAEERRAWAHVSQRLTYGDPPPELRHLLNPYAPEEPPPSGPTSTVVTPATASVAVLRGVDPAVDGKATVHVQVTNTSDVPVRRVVLRDALPASCEYAWGSASSDRGALTVSGGNPLRFELEEVLAKGQSLEVRYSVVLPPADR
jgi:uncharacterized repeat protein (TIGR01451 family)